MNDITIRPVVECKTCEKEFVTTYFRKDRNRKSYCSRDCYNKRRSEDLKKIKRHTAFYDKLLEDSNCECGVSEDYLLQIHHVDGDNSNNNIKNLEVVCANCHIKRHLKRRISDGKWVYSPKTLTDRSLLNIITCLK